MNNIWIIAQTGNGDAITSEPMSEGDTATTSTTSQDGSPNNLTDKDTSNNKSPGLANYIIPIVP